MKTANEKSVGITWATLNEMVRKRPMRNTNEVIMVKVASMDKSFPVTSLTFDNGKIVMIVD